MASRNYVPSSIQSVPYPTHAEMWSNAGACLAVTGTGAALDVALPFDPAYVEVFNLTQLKVCKKYPTLTGDDFLQEVTAGTKSVVTADGMTLGTKKVTLGSGVHAASDVLHVLAFPFPGESVGV